MNEDIWNGRWKQVRGKIRETWGALTDDELDRAAGRRDQLIGAIQKRTGQAREEVATALERIAKSVRSSS
jgi:uncharacterized protein YjbJ (UPF0337 family)